MSFLRFLLIIQILAGVTYPVIAQPVGFSNPFPITPVNIALNEFYISKERAPYLFTIFTEKRTKSQNLWISYSKKSRIAFKAPIKIRILGNTYPMFPSIACNSKYAIALWQEETASGLISLFYTFASLDSKSSQFMKWSQPKSLVKRATTSLDIFLGIIQGGKDSVFHIFYHKKMGRIIKLFHVKIKDPESDERKAHALPLARGIDVRGNFFPSVYISGNKIFLSWQTKSLERTKDILNDELFYIYSSNNGNSWSNPYRLTKNLHADFTPYLFQVRGKPAVIFSSRPQKSWLINLKILINGKWSEPIVLSHSNSNTFKPAAILYKNMIRSFWYDYRNGIPAIFMQNIEAIDHEQKMLPIEQIKENVAKEDILFSVMPGSHQEPTLIPFGKRFAVIWKRLQGRSKRLFMKLPDIDAPGLVVQSPTHPNKAPYWSSSLEGFIYWKKPKDPSGIAGYAFLISKKKDEVPTLQTHTGDIDKIKFSNLKEGKQWAHIRAIDNAQNFGPTAHYPLWLDLSGPKIDTIIGSLPRNTPSSENNPSFKWQSTESKDFNKFAVELYREKKLFKKLTVNNSSISFENLKEGKWLFRVQAVDPAGNKGNILEYPFIVFDDKSKPSAPDITVSNLVDGFFSEMNNVLAVQISPKKSISAFYGLLTAITKGKYDISDYKTELPEKRLSLDIADKKKGFYWIRIKVKYGDGRLSKTAFYPFFKGNEREYIDSIKLIQDASRLTIRVKSNLFLGTSRLYWKGYKKIPNKIIYIKSGSVPIDKFISYKYFTKGDYLLKYALLRPDGKRTAYINYRFHSNSRYVLPESIEPKDFEIYDDWQGLIKLKLIEIIEKEEIVPIVDTVMRILKGEEVEEIHINIRNLPMWLFVVSLPITLIITFIVLFWNLVSFRFFIGGVIFKIRWRLGLLKPSLID